MKCFQLVLKIVLLSGTLFLHLSALGQSPSDLALKNIQKQKWQRAYQLLTKALAKDSLNVTAKYVLAQYFFSEGNPEFQLDSAYRHVLEALGDFEQTTLKQRDRLKRFPVDSIQLVHLRKQIDSVAFLQAEMLNTEKAFNDFIVRFPFSNKINLAIEVRDRIAYATADSLNTSSAFHYFVNQYPEANQILDAKEGYEKLLLVEKTSDQTLASYENFLITYPNTPYRSVVDQTIFEYCTASGEIEAFSTFVERYPQNVFRSRARNILFHLIPAVERAQKWAGTFATDSLVKVMRLEDNYLVPFLQNGKFGFMNKHGVEVIPASSDSIDQRYQCGNITEDVISLSDKIVSNTGALIWEEKINSMDDLGFGFLFVQGERCRFLIHKTGFQIGDGCMDDAKILNGKFLAIRQGQQWSLWTLAGRELKKDLEDVFCIKDVIVLKTNDKFTLITGQELTIFPASKKENENQFDEVKSWPDNLIFVSLGMNSGLLDQTLNSYIDLAKQELAPTFFGVSATSPTGTLLYSSSGQKSDTLQHVLIQDPWIAVRSNSWRLCNPQTLQFYSPAYDTILFSGAFAIAHRKDSIRLYFSEHKFRQWSQPIKVEFIPGQDSTAFVVIEQGDQKSLYNQKGRRLFSLEMDKIQYAGNDLFIVHRKEKKGLISATGKLLLPVEYDAIGTVNKGQISLLKSRKFGLFDYNKKKLIKPGYLKNLVPYNTEIVTAYQDGLYGFIGWDNRPLSKFEFSDIQYWNDSAAVVKKNSQWMIYEIKTKRILMDKIKDYKLIQDKPQQKLAIIHQDIRYGVMDNKKGIVIPISFSDVINVGSADEPMYFTEKRVVEASIYVVIYYDEQGQMLRKEVYDQQDYDKIYCSDN